MMGGLPKVTTASGRSAFDIDRASRQPLKKNRKNPLSRTLSRSRPLAPPMPTRCTSTPSSFS